MIGFAMCGSFCTHARALGALERLRAQGREILPILSERAASTDTRFGTAAALRQSLAALTGRQPIVTVAEAEPLGPAAPLEALILAPCTGSTLAKLAAGITDSSVTMAAKAHLRCDRPLLIALATNDALSANLSSIARLVTRRGVYFVPMRQDDPCGKPHSLVAEFEKIPEALAAMERGESLRPLFLEPARERI